MGSIYFPPRAIKLLVEDQLSIGSLYYVKNKEWKKTTEFAKNKPDNSCHPGLIIELNKSESKGRLIPGTSSWHEKSCKVFRVKLVPEKTSYFLFIFYIYLPYIDIGSLNKYKTPKLEEKNIDKCLVKWNLYCEKITICNEDS